MKLFHGTTSSRWKLRNNDDINYLYLTESKEHANCHAIENTEADNDGATPLVLNFTLSDVKKSGMNHWMI